MTLENGIADGDVSSSEPRISMKYFFLGAWRTQYNWRRYLFSSITNLSMKLLWSEESNAFKQGLRSEDIRTITVVGRWNVDWASLEKSTEWFRFVVAC